ncbi:hypothetical protein FRC07_012238, partial [Ceratobasidium sp. 392]
MSSPIQTLPTEILARILSEATCFCQNLWHKYDSIPSVLSPISSAAICHHWRQVAIGHRALWTHIDLVINVMDHDGKYHRPEIWTERSKGTPLSIHVLQPRFPNDGQYVEEEEEEMMAGFPDTELQPKPMVNRLAAFLLPLMPLVSSLTVGLSWPYESTLMMLMNCWTTHGTPGQAKVLKALMNMELADVKFHPSINSSFLESLEILHLHNATLPWSSFFFNNLIELDVAVGEGQQTIALFELAAVLLSSPRLQRLSLDALTIEPFPAEQTKPVVLSQLRGLRVAGFSNIHQRDGAGMVQSVLALISPGGYPLSVEVDLSCVFETTQRALDAICAFVGRYNVTKLHVHASWVTHFWKDPYFATQLGPLPRVETLTLEQWTFGEMARFDIGGMTPIDYHNPRSINPEL